MGALEDAIAAGDTAKQAELSSFFRDAQANNITGADFAPNPSGRGYYIPDPAKREAYARIQVAGERQNREQRQQLADLIAVAKGIDDLDPQIQQNILQSLGIGGRGGRPPAAVQKAMIDRQRALEVARMQARGRVQASGQQGRPIPAGIIGTIGTPQFRQQVQSAAQQGQLDRQSFATLANLDRQEREFQARSNRPGRLSPAAKKLREMEALGILIDENTARDIYAPTSMNTLTGREDPRRRQPLSLSGLAGLTGSAPDERNVPANQESGQDELRIYDTGEEERRRRLRAIIAGGAEY